MSAPRPRGGRRWLAPEVVQSSAMDCGPASLKCLLEGFGIPASYDRLREACQTGLDGTSIDTLEELAVTLGLDAEQCVLPADHLFLPAARTLPALVVVANAQGVTHFVVVWRRWGGWLQVMDPGSGRRWTTVAPFSAELYRHRMRVPAAAWREWAGSDAARATFAARLDALEAPGELAGELLGRAAADPSWRAFATLDAALRLGAVLVAAGALRRGREVAALVRRCAADPAEPMLARYFTVEQAADDGEAAAELWLSGAVLLRVAGRRPAAAGAAPSLPAELAAIVAEPERSPGRRLWDLAIAEGARAPGILVLGLAAASLAVVAEALLFRGLLDLGVRLVQPQQRWLAGLLLAALLAALAGLEVALIAGTMWLGRRLEISLRLGLLAKIPRLGDRYLASRLSSDMAERCHSVHRLRLGPELVANTLRSVFQVVLTAAAIAWLDSRIALLAAASAALAIGLPLVLQPWLGERDLRLRSHAGALGRFYLDALLGMQPLRCHVAGPAMRREHEGMLREWVLAALAVERGALALEVASTVAGYALAILMVALHLQASSQPAQALLLAFWALNIPLLGQQLALTGRQAPVQQNTARRLLEPLAVGAEPPAAPAAAAEPDRAPAAAPAAGVAIAFAGVAVVAGGHSLVEEVELQIPAGCHLAMVGPSGAGKSTLLGLLLGWHQAAAGALTVDGRPLDAAGLEALRRVTAWVDPAVQLWNRSLLENLVYGGDPDACERLAEIREAALLGDLLEALPEAFGTRLGEGGALVSGGEGQRVRLGRSLARARPRLVLLDEPFRGLEREVRRRLMGAARERWRAATLICVTHDLEHSRGFDRVAVIAGGRLEECGAPAELLARPGSRYAAMVAEEERVRRRFDQDPGWRRLALAEGRLAGPPTVAAEG